MKTVCPECRQKYEIDAEYNGYSIECPQCKNNFIIEPFLQSSSTRLIPAKRHANIQTYSRSSGKLYTSLHSSMFIKYFFINIINYFRFKYFSIIPLS
jgi:uncharacterized protein YbaR (Trm112 family)